jgi:hypothetical protein
MEIDDVVWTVPRMSQSLLIERARALNDFSQRVKHLTGHADGFEEIDFAGRIDDFFAGIMPVKVHDRFLQTQQVIDRADDHVHCSCVTGLRPQIVLPVCIDLFSLFKGSVH